jgi:predicted ArsR family transcriptional regulator
MSDTPDRILYMLKRRGPQTAQAVARRFEMSDVAARKQLAGLVADGLVAFTEPRRGVGRPQRLWQLTPAGHARFPDGHEGLTLELIEAVREVFGEDGLDRLIDERERRTYAEYAATLARHDDLGAKVRRLAELRREEGYMAETQRSGKGFLLIENHCPICAAAESCQGFCRAELDIFERVLGPDVAVERIEHILAGARRCAYRIMPLDV